MCCGSNTAIGEEAVFQQLQGISPFDMPDPYLSPMMDSH